MVLRETAERMGARIRQYDVLARIGGEEFLLIAPETGLDDAQVLAERLRCSICDAAFEVDGSTIDMTVSFGVHDRSTGRRVGGGARGACR